MDDLSLETRAGLPDALRALVEAYPRESWEAHRHFGGLVQFWLERHMMFRRLHQLLREDVEKLLDGNADPGNFAGRLSRYGSMFVGELLGHHNIEDVHYFPVLSGRESSLARGFEILDRDHHALDAHLGAFVERANMVIAGRDAPDLRDQAGAYHADVVRLGRFLDRHLLDEEDLVVPVILRHGPSGLG
jgi:iron-sulfur cluster repair protein YtfE (RIC family)